MKGPSDAYLRDLALRWRRSGHEPRADLVESIFRDAMAGLGPFTREEIEVFCRGVTMTALAAVMGGLARPFEGSTEALAFVELLACRAAVEAENARRA